MAQTSFWRLLYPSIISLILEALASLPITHYILPTVMSTTYQDYTTPEFQGSKALEVMD